jgi:hypothetical protein
MDFYSDLLLGNLLDPNWSVRVICNDDKKFSKLLIQNESELLDLKIRRQRRLFTHKQNP